MIRHIITWKLTATDDAGRAAAFDAMAEGFGSLPALIPEIKTLHLGRDIDETPGNWDVVLVIDYASTADLEAYQVHPEHQRVKAIVAAHVTERAAVDFEL
jgi:Stress responsive A/B Barrel Domain